MPQLTQPPAAISSVPHQNHPALRRGENKTVPGTLQILRIGKAVCIAFWMSRSISVSREILRGIAVLLPTPRASPTIAQASTGLPTPVWPTTSSHT
jgi:multisubunit Na+/H+ antiporter MnhG subunit